MNLCSGRENILRLYDSSWQIDRPISLFLWKSKSAASSKHFFGTVPPSLCVFFSFKFCPFSCSLTKNRCRRWQLHRPTTERYFDFNSMENIIFFNLLHCSSFVAVCIWTAMLNFGKVSIVTTTEIWCSIKHEIGEQEANRSESDELVFGQSP